MRTELRLACLVAGVIFLAACATRTPPPLPVPLQHPEFVYPLVPQGLSAARGSAGRLDAGWRYLQNGDLVTAEQEFAGLLRRQSEFYPAQTGLGWVELARRAYSAALASFSAALDHSADYVPALVGRGQTLLALNREDEALSDLERALSLDASLSGLRGRVEVLRFRNLQDIIASAATAAAEGRWEDSREAYEMALRATPDSAFLHRDLGVVERKAGRDDVALVHLRRAVELEAQDPVPHAEIGAILEARQDFAAAEAAYRRAAAIEPSEELTGRIAAVAARAREATLPPPFAAITAAREVTRGELAALIGVRLESLVTQARQRQVVMTDIGGHWAAPWITQVARAGLIEPFENHTFQPRVAVRRGDLAVVVGRVVALIAPASPELRARLSREVRLADMNKGHLSYAAAVTAVAAGVLDLADGNRFQVGRTVTGAEAVTAISRLQALAGLR